MAAYMKCVIGKTELTFSVLSACRRNIRCMAIQQKEQQASTTDLSSQSSDIRVQETNCDWVSPPSKVSNIRRIKFYVPPDETSLQRELREKREETQEWHHQFWTKHNTNFTQTKEEFTKTKKTERLKGGTPEDEFAISPEEMSVFYKKFLDENFEMHKRYNRAWYKKNFHLLWLALKVNVEKAFSFRKPQK